MDLREFDFDLPTDLIAQEPAAERGEARLLCLNRKTGARTHAFVSALPELLTAGDLVVVNNTRVFPARLLGKRIPSGGSVECMLLHRLDAERWEALMHPGQKLRPGAHVRFDGVQPLHAEVLERLFHGRRIVRLWTENGSSIDDVVDAIGHVPLPPYIKREDRVDDRERYQTIFARTRGSIAAPTAGLHFNSTLMTALAERGVDVAEITLHVGYGTFQPLRVEHVEENRLHPEQYEISERASALVNRALVEGRRVIAVGTTTTRALETVAMMHDGRVVPGAGETDIFIYPGFEFRVLSGLMTNFHLPRSSLLMLVAAFAGRDRVLAAYRAAIAERYRFYSYGDAMLII